MAVMWAYILDDEAVAKAAALFIGLRSQFVTSKREISKNISQMAQLFDREESNIRRHVLNVFKENEIEENNNVQKIHVNNVKKSVPFYSLDVIIFNYSPLQK